MHFFFSEGQFSFKKKNLLRKALALHTEQITDEPLVKSHLGLHLVTRICSWSAGEGCVFTGGGLGEEGLGE